jgi:hypothetical protein
MLFQLFTVVKLFQRVCFPPRTLHKKALLFNVSILLVFYQLLSTFSRKTAFALLFCAKKGNMGLAHPSQRKKIAPLFAAVRTAPYPNG